VTRLLQLPLNSRHLQQHWMLPLQQRWMLPHLLKLTLP